MKHIRREGTRNFQETGRREEKDTIHLIQRVHLILIQNHPSLLVIQTHMCPRLRLVPQVKTDARREKDLLKETNIDVEKEEINDVKKGERDVIRDPNVDQEGSYCTFC